MANLRQEDDPLELERIADGPYCPYDDFRPSPTSQNRELGSSSDSKRIKMEDVLSNEFPGNGMQGPWLVSSGDDVQPSDNLTSANWDDWMRWTPSQTQTPKPLNIQGPLCYLNPEASRLYNRRSSQNEEVVPASSSIPFTFGQPLDSAPAFQFSAPLATSPVISAPPRASEWVSNPNLVSPLPTDGGSQFQRPPPPLSTPSLGHSPESAPMQRTSPSDHSSPESAGGPNKKKRKSSTGDDSADAADNTPVKQQPIKKTAHNMIEKRYRTNLNDKIAALRDSVPSLRVMSRSGNGEDEDDQEDLEGLTPAHKLNKATVLSKATEYIRHLEKRNKRLQEEVNSLKARVDAYDKMAMTGGPFAFQTGVPTPDTTRFDPDPFVRTPPGGVPGQRHPQGMIPVPDSISQLHQAAVNQPHYANPAYGAAPPGRPVPGPSVATGPPDRNGMMSKLMVGSLAGLMLMEGFSRREQSGEGTEARGLFALPLPLLSRLTGVFNSPSIFGPTGVLPILKIFLIIGAFIYLIAPLFDFKPKLKSAKSAPVRLAPAPSLASPVEVRRKAWLTAIQTVWVPQHSFPLEAAALLLKTLKLSIRRLIGWNGYSLVTGTTREQEAARVKAWEIALDAQLTGGDAEISTNRLLLTLLASGTLPDTPARLMLKALHVRLMLWDMSKNGCRSWWFWTFDNFNMNMARSYWIAAREEQRLLKHGISQVDGAEPLPEHLEALLEQKCDDVLVDAIIQRAYNLAWNNPTSQDAQIDETMDGVVEDFAISSPLDALASWWSSLQLSRVLVQALDTTDESSSSTSSLLTELENAIQTAPPTSRSHVRALAAKAVFSTAEDDITAAYEVLPRAPLSSPTGQPPSSPQAMLNIIQQSPVKSDVLEALTLAKILNLLSLADARAYAIAVAAMSSYNPSETSFSLLSFVAAYKVLQRFADDEELLGVGACKDSVERCAVALRIWMGREKGARSGLGSRRRARVVVRCLDVGKMVVGVREKGEVEEDVDEGFVSADEKETVFKKRVEVEN